MKVWEHLTMYRGFHPKSNTQRLYTSQKEGKRDAVSIKAIVLNEIQSIQVQISKMAPKDELLRCLRQQQTREEDQAEDQAEAEEVPCQNKTLHGRYH